MTPCLNLVCSLFYFFLNGHLARGIFCPFYALFSRASCPNAKSQSKSCCPRRELSLRQRPSFFSFMKSLIWTLESWNEFGVAWQLHLYHLYAHLGLLAFKFCIVTHCLQRTLPAIAVIFSEDPNGRKRKKRWISNWQEKRENQSPDKLTFLRRILSGIKRLYKRFMKNLQCLTPRLARRFGNLNFPQSQLNDFPGNSDEFGQEKQETEDEFLVDDVTDCFDDVEEPRYGYRVQVMLNDEEPCEIGSTCLGVDGNISALEPNLTFYQQFFHRTLERQTNENFVSSAPPDCRLRNSCG